MPAALSRRPRVSMGTVFSTGLCCAICPEAVEPDFLTEEEYVADRTRPGYHRPGGDHSTRSERKAVQATGGSTFRCQPLPIGRSAPASAYVATLNDGCEARRFSAPFLATFAVQPGKPGNRSSCGPSNERQDARRNTLSTARLDGTD